MRKLSFQDVITIWFMACAFSMVVGMIGMVIRVPQELRSNVLGKFKVVETRTNYMWERMPIVEDRLRNIEENKCNAK